MRRILIPLLTGIALGISWVHGFLWVTSDSAPIITDEIDGVPLVRVRPGVKVWSDSADGRETYCYESETSGTLRLYMEWETLNLSQSTYIFPGGTTITAQDVPEWFEDAARQNMPTEMVEMRLKAELEARKADQ